jgi:hypothetical protein
MENEILNLLLETLKIQAEKYKVIVNDDSLTHEQRKEFDTEITQMYNVLANLSNSSTIYTLAELKALKAQYDVKFTEFDEKVKNLDLSHLLVSFDSLTQEQKDFLKGQNGLSAYEIAVNEGFEGTQSEWLKSLKGLNGTFEALTQEQKNILFEEFKISIDLTSILTRMDTLESGKSSGSDELLKFVIKEIATKDNIEENGTRILTNLPIEVGDILSIEYNLGGLVCTDVLKAVKPEETLYFESIQEGSDNSYALSTGLQLSVDGNLIITTQVYSKPSFVRFDADYNVSIKVDFVTPKQIDFEFVEVTQDTLVFENWLGY